MAGPTAYIPGTRAWRQRRDLRMCRETGERIQEIVDGEMPADAARARLQHHLDACERCGAEAETIRELKRAIARVCEISDPELVARLEGFCRELSERGPDALERPDV